MNSHEEERNTSMIFSMGREGTNVYNNFQEGMPCDYDLKDESSFDECHTVIESVIDDDKACIEKLLSHKEAKKKRNKGYIMPQKPAGTGITVTYGHALASNNQPTLKSAVFRSLPSLTQGHYSYHAEACQ